MTTKNTTTTKFFLNMLALLACITSASAALPSDASYSTTIPTLTILKNVHSKDLSHDEIDFFERSWLDVYHQVVVQEDYDSEMAASFLVTALVPQEEKEESQVAAHRGLYGWSGWFTNYNWLNYYWLTSVKTDGACRLCDEDDDYWPYPGSKPGKGRSLEEFGNAETSSGGLRGRSGIQSTGSSLSSSSSLQVHGDLMDDYDLDRHLVRTLDANDSHYHDNMTTRMQLFGTALLDKLTEGPFEVFHGLEDIELEIGAKE